MRTPRLPVASKLVLAAAILGLAGGCAAGQDAGVPEDAPADAGPGAFAFVRVSVLPMDAENVLLDQTVLVRDGRIEAVDRTDLVEVPEGATVIDGTGRYLMPGVVEMHGHYPDPGDDFTPDLLFLYVANGVTAVRGMQGGPEHVPLRESIEAREILGPRLWVSAPAMGGGPNGIVDPEVAVQRVQAAAASGVDHLKVHEGLTLEVYDAIADTANEVGLPFAGHVSNLVGLRHALEKGQATVDHLDNVLEAMVDDRNAVAGAGLFGLADLVGQIDEEEIGEVVEAFREAGAGVVPTMELWEILFGAYSVEEIEAERPEIRFMPARTVQSWRDRVADSHEAALPRIDDVRAVLDLRQRVLDALHEGGVPVLLGTDSPQIYSVPGFSIHHEMQIMVESGLTPFQVLEAGTRAVAEFQASLGADGDFGTVAAGRRADLVLLDANPLEEIGNFARRAGVMANGQWLPEEEIRRRLAEIEDRVAAGGAARGGG